VIERKSEGSYSISYLLYRLDVVARNQFVIGVEELDACLFEGALCEKQTFDA